MNPIKRRCPFCNSKPETINVNGQKVVCMNHVCGIYGKLMTAKQWESTTIQQEYSTTEDWEF